MYRDLQIVDIVVGYCLFGEELRVFRQKSQFAVSYLFLGDCEEMLSDIGL